MKLFKYFLSAILIVTTIWSCTDEDFGSLDFLSTATPPANVAALFNVTQDNTGTVTITPNSEGAVSYDIFYGDNTSSPGNVKQGKSIVHVYNEGTYNVKIVAIGITGLTTEMTHSLVVSFKAPENLVVVIQNDAAVSKKVNVTATADFAMLFEVYFGEPGHDEPVLANNGGTASYVYQQAGTYTIRVVSKSAAIQTTSYTEEFVVTAILQPTASAPTPPFRQAANVISVYSGAYDNVPNSNYNPDWGQSGQGSGYAEFDLNGDKMLNYIKLSYQGIDLGSAINASSMEFLHIDIWTANDMSIDIYPLPNGVAPADERFVTKTLVANQWNSFNIPLSEFTSQGLPLGNLKQFKFVGSPWATGTVFIDNLYFYKAPAPSSGLEGSWKLAPEAGALKVGPSSGSGEWWANSAADITTRACLFDDTYVFGSNGSFNNVLGASTWLEAWQGTADACGTPVAPHNGSNAATYLYDAVAGTITLDGTGAFLGLPKATNAGELPNVAVPTSRTYKVVLSDGNNTMNLVIETGSGVFWSFKLVRDGAVTPPPVTGSTPKNPINFEASGFGADWTWTVFENVANPALEIISNPDATGINTSSKVAKFTALQGGQPWAGLESKHGQDIGSFKFDATNKIVRIMVWKSVISDVGLKFAEANGDAQPEVKVANTKINQWEELRFDMSGSIGKGATGIIDQIIIFPDFKARTQDNVVYFDNITFSSN
jgi:hypothetical protein